LYLKEFEEHLETMKWNQEQDRVNIEGRLFKQFEEKLQNEVKSKVKEVENQKSKV